MLTFDEPSHVYTWMGFEIPSLSKVLEQGGVGTDYSQIPEGVLAFARERGKAVHRYVEAHLKGQELEWGSEEAEAAFEAACSGYVTSYHRALSLLPDLGGGAVEVSVGGECGYGTTPDVVTDTHIIEWKTTSRIYPSHYVQLAGQSHALCHGGASGSGPERERIIVQLQANGKPVIKTDKNTEWHDDVFKAALTICKYKGVVKRSI